MVADGLRPGLRTELNSGVSHLIHPDLNLKLEITELLLGTQEGIHTVWNRRADNGTVFYRITMCSIVMHPAFQGFSVKQFDPTCLISRFSNCGGHDQYEEMY